MSEKITWTRVNNDSNGNPRYVCHFLNFIDREKDDPEYLCHTHELYETALSRARKLGGKKFHNKQYGGGIVFQSYNIDDLEKKIGELMNESV